MGRFPGLSSDSMSWCLVVRFRRRVLLEFGGGLRASPTLPCMSETICTRSWL